MKNFEITCKNCYSYGDTHSSCFKVRHFEVDEESPACKDLKYKMTCKRDCNAYGDMHSSCFKVRDGEVNEKTLACENISLRKQTIEMLKTIKRELIVIQEPETLEIDGPKTYKLGSL